MPDSDSNRDSLIERDGAQLPLIEVPQEYREGMERAGEFTGERLFAQDPDRYRGIVLAIAEGMPQRSIAKVFKVSPHTIRAIRARESGPIATDKKEIAGNFRRFVRLASDRLVEEVDDIPIDKLPLAAAIVVDKMQLLEGEATVITGKAHNLPDPAQFNELVAAMGRVVEAPENTGLGTGGNLQIGDGGGEGSGSGPGDGVGVGVDGETGMTGGDAVGTEGGSVVDGAESLK